MLFGGFTVRIRRVSLVFEGVSRLKANGKLLKRSRQEGVTSVFTFGGEVHEFGSPPMPQKLDDAAKQSIAMLSVGSLGGLGA